MGFADKIKGLTKQAQDTVAEHKDQIREAVDAAGVAADRKTHGKYTDKIAKAGEKAGGALDKLAGEPEAGTADGTATEPGTAA